MARFTFEMNYCSRRGGEQAGRVGCVESLDAVSAGVILTALGLRCPLDHISLWLLSDLLKVPGFLPSWNDLSM